MTELELRTRIRELMAADALPSGPALIERPRTHTVVNSPLPEPCTICGEAGPQVSYFWLAGLVVRVHAACDAPGRPPPDVVRVAYPLEG